MRRRELCEIHSQYAADQAKAHNMGEADVFRGNVLAPQPTCEFVQSEEIAGPAAIFCGGIARSITGAAISIDGGPRGSPRHYPHHEAFGAQSLAMMCGFRLDTARAKFDGGAVALGHPIGPSGARTPTILLHPKRIQRARRDVATPCIADGMGTVIAVEHV